MQLDNFFSSSANADSFSFNREQASAFAKQIADDFNPIHDVDAKRFCVPGDLLFAIALNKLGLSQQMHVNFAGMVTDGIELKLTENDSGHIDIQDNTGKTYLSVHQAGEKTQQADTIAHLTKEYVAFSGKTFPHVLVPLWKSKGVMLNPARLMVIYESMSIDLQSLDFQKPSLELVDSRLEVNGKRGSVLLSYAVKEGERLLGSGEKRMVLSGLKPYDQQAIDDLVKFHNERKATLG